MILICHQFYESESCLLQMIFFPSGRQLAQSTGEKVSQFHNDAEVSANMPGMKDYISIRNENNERTHVQKRLFLANLREVHSNFQIQHSNHKILFSLFASL